MFASWGALAHRRRWVVLIAVVVLAVLGGAWGLGVFDKLSQGGYEAPDSEAARAKTVVEQALGRQGGDVVVVYTTPDGTTVDDQAIAEKITTALHGLPSDSVKTVLSYWDTRQLQFADQAKQRGLAVITLTATDSNTQIKQYEQIRDQLNVEGVRAQIGGLVPTQTEISDLTASDLTRAEAVSMPVVLILLVILFGSLVAALLPVLVGGLTILASLGVLHAISLGTDVNSFAVNVASLLGLGLAIDYGLFTVGRFREELANGRSTAEAVRRTVSTAGRTVAFSATLLVVALAGLLLFPQGFLKSLSYGGMSAVALAAIISLTLLPAMLAILGPRVDKLSLPWRRRAAASTAGPVEEGAGWRRLGERVMRRPVLFALPIVVVLVALGSPFLNVRFGEVDQKVLPEGNPARQAIEVINAEFPALSGNGLNVVVHGEHGAAPDQAAVQQFAAQVGTVPGINQVQVSGAGGDVVTLSAGLSVDALSDEADQAMRQVRELTPPSGTEVLVGGITAQVNDSLDEIANRLPWMAVLLVGATLVLMFLAFGSVLLPVKAVVMSALSLSATFGVLVWVFQDGHGASLLNVTPAPLEAGVVVLMAAVVFGLSTDYEVFLLSRMVEARNRGESTPAAVATGLAKTGRVITAAAILLIVVTGAFAFSQVAIMRFVGVGMILALALDATVVRMLLVPAVLRLLGNASWWAPGPLRRLQQRVGMHEGEPDEADARELERV
ncbi:putative drug exporter of the RND superfamily [Goodfellowiella coeruleoviolacea]|uniref:Drug exporter of the RND superfamily n=1 Tax=Goodfellowiella coeruleoviolacea TaxID=334858 RepID=A0AAE3GIQ9_9PSEU|nr:putative drug exporter of the RND superfamily [Goodfellowiella coeruleoviolacea]